MTYSLQRVELPFDQTSFRCDPTQCFVPVPKEIEADLSCALIQRLYAWGMMKLPAAERAQLRASSDMAQRILECLEREFSAQRDFKFSLSKHGHLNVVASPAYAARLVSQRLFSELAIGELAPLGLSPAAKNLCSSVELSSILMPDGGEGSQEDFPQKKRETSLSSAIEFLANLACPVNNYREISQSSELSPEDKLMFLALCVDPEIDERRYLASLETEANVPYFLKAVLQHCLEFADSLAFSFDDSSSLEAFFSKSEVSKGRPWTHAAVLGKLRGLCLSARGDLLDPSLFASEQRRLGRALATARLFRTFYNHPGNRLPQTEYVRGQAALVARLSAALIQEALSELSFNDLASK